MSIYLTKDIKDSELLKILQSIGSHRYIMTEMPLDSLLRGLL
jgi:hypothetical protein